MMKFRPFMLAAALVAAGLTTLAGVSPALASEAAVTVEHRDLNLASDTGRAALDARIERAARLVCGTAYINELDIAAGVAACRAEVVSAARAQRDALLGGDTFAELRVARSVRAAS